MACKAGFGRGAASEAHADYHQPACTCGFIRPQPQQRARVQGGSGFAQSWDKCLVALCIGTMLHHVWLLLANVYLL